MCDSLEVLSMQTNAFDDNQAIVDFGIANPDATLRTITELD